MMPIRRLLVEIECPNCHKKATIGDNLLASYDGHLWGEGNEIFEDLRYRELPEGWISCEWVYKVSVNYGEKDGHDFCGIGCLISYFLGKLKGKKVEQN
jgi:hypothetical protein